MTRLWRKEKREIQFSELSLFFFFSSLFRAAPTAYGGSQARGEVGAIALAYATATAMPDPRCICDLHHSSRPCWILNPLSEANLHMANRFISAESWWELPVFWNLNEPYLLLLLNGCAFDIFELKLSRRKLGKWPEGARWCSSKPFASLCCPSPELE